MQKREAALVNIKAERAVLGSLLQSEHAYWEAGMRLSASDFSVPVHRDIFSAIKETCEGANKFALTTIIAKCPETYDDGKLTQAYIYALLSEIEVDGSGLDLVDEVADASQRRSIEAIAKELLKAARDASKTAMDTINGAQARLADVDGTAGERPTVTMRQVIDRCLVRAQKAYQNADDPRGNYYGFDTGITPLDEILGPLRRGRLYFLGGAEKSGKTLLAAQILRRVASRNVYCFMAQGEMQEEEIGFRELASASDVPTNKIESGEFTFAEYDAIQDAIGKIPLDNVGFWQCGDVRFSQFANRCRAEKRRHGDVGLIVADHLLHLQPDKDFDNEFRGIASVVHKLKQLAVDLDCVMLVMTHRTRNSQERNDPTPYATDFYGGGVIERACDALFCIYSKYRWLSLRKPSSRGSEQMERDSMAKWQAELEATAGKAQIALLSHRHAPFPKITEVRFRGDVARLENI